MTPFRMGIDMLKITKLQKEYLSIASEIFQERAFDPIVRTKDHNFDKIEPIQNAFFDLISYFGTIGISVHVEQTEMGEYEITYIDFMEFKPADFKDEYKYAVLYASLFAGAYLSKDAIGNYLSRKLTSNDMTVIKKVFKDNTASELTKTKDNRYTIMRGNKDEY